jgi:tellurite methyltransferase
VTQQDRERWNRKYAAGNPNATFEPEPLLLQYAHLLTGHGMALDLACGVGHNAIFLARRGYEVLAVDASLVGLGYCRTRLKDSQLRVHLVAADLDDFALPRDTFALVIVFRFLSRPLLPRIKQTLAPGGLLIQQTFNLNQLRIAPQMNPEYLLQPGELARTFADFETIATNDTADNSSELTYWVGRRP